MVDIFFLFIFAGKKKGKEFLPARSRGNKVEMSFNSKCYMLPMEAKICKNKFKSRSCYFHKTIQE